MENYRVLRIAVCLVFLSGGIILAQVNTGTISGTVTDSTGAALPHTQIVILNEDLEVHVPWRPMRQDIIQRCR